MTAETLILETHRCGEWHPTAEVTVFDPARGSKSRTRVGYLNDYIAEHAESLGTRDARAIAEQYPVSFETWMTDGWPAFLYDIVPSGAARRWWSNQLATSFETEAELDSLILRNHTNAPVGHVRVAVVGRSEEIVAFSREDVLARDVGFLEYAAARGAAIGGATGAGGDAPKVLLAEDAAGNVYPAGTIADDETAACWFVKWPRGRDTSADRLVLETEHLYAHALAKLGLDTCPGTLEKSGGYKPSLWLPRFDRRPAGGRVERLAIESLYSLAGVARMGAAVKHQTFLKALRRALANREQLEDLPELVREYVRRDLLDVVLGNSDNHGRNRAIIRDDRLRWAPIYDLAPMVLDPAGIRRSTTWDQHEYGGRIDWPGVCAELEAWLPGLELRESLHSFTNQMLKLPEMLLDAGVDDAVMSASRVYLADLGDTLTRWGLR